MFSIASEWFLWNENLIWMIFWILEKIFFSHFLIAIQNMYEHTHTH